MIRVSWVGLMSSILIDPWNIHVTSSRVRLSPKPESGDRVETQKTQRALAAAGS